MLRKRSGDPIVVVDSAGSVFEAAVDADDGAFARLAGLMATPAEPRVAVTLAQAIPKGHKMDEVVEKTTQLGVAAIVPVRSHRVIGLETSPGKLERWRRIAGSAAAQSGRARVPEVAEIHTWERLIATFPQYDAWEGVEPLPLRERLGALLGAAQRVLVAIGPEGGFSHDEAAAATSAGAHAIALGPRILRTETAGLVALAAILYERGEL